MAKLTHLPPSFHLSDEIADALQSRYPVVALESTVITHGLPFPDNLALAREMEEIIRQYGAVPATISVIKGKIMIGAAPDQLELLARGEGMRKISSRDFSTSIAKGESGGTTVAGTLFAASTAGIQVFATGGIGGVHRSPAFDISADLIQLSKSAVIVVCAGAKAILDLPATLEYLETLAIPVIGYQTNEFPAFYSIRSGLRTSMVAETPAEVAAIARAHWGIGMESAVLVSQSPPEAVALPKEAVETAIQQALEEAQKQEIRGQAITPFLLQRVSTLTSGASLKANLGLLKNNARLAALIACRMNDP